MSSLRGALITERFAFDGGRSVTAYVPLDPPDAVVYVADGGWHIEHLAEALETSLTTSSTMLVGVLGLEADDGRLLEYVEAVPGPCGAPGPATPTPPAPRGDAHQTGRPTPG